MAKILYIGGHGKVALLTHPLLVQDGHTVDAVIRNPDHAEDVRAAGATPIVKDIESLDIEGFTDLIRGHDIVVWGAGAGGGAPERTYAVDRDAAIMSMDAAKKAGVSRYVMVSYYGSGPDHPFEKGTSMYDYGEAKAAADAHLRESGLNWTILGPSTLTLDEPSGKITHSGRSHVSRGNVARVIAAVVADGLTGSGHSIHSTIEFNDGDTPIEDAIK